MLLKAEGLFHRLIATSCYGLTCNPVDENDEDVGLGLVHWRIFALGRSN